MTTSDKGGRAPGRRRTGGLSDSPLPDIDESGATDTPRVEAVISATMRRYRGVTPAALARYFEAVHQELGPLARELEREVSVLTARVRQLEEENARLRASSAGVAEPRPANGGDDASLRR
ncbi:hypothetical protein [Paraburkholderia sp. SIMBA_054]|uniref:hypothetical protein n=1 Tax=Paraburkholderia sp. SIMBA_054 TaxID=3085795 RepID=UPI00397C83E9